MSDPELSTPGGCRPTIGWTCGRPTRSISGQGRLSVFLDVFNLYNRQNVRSFNYKVSLPEGTVIAETGETLLPLLPSFGFTWEF